MATKNANAVKSNHFQDDKQNSGKAVLARVYWMLIGNIILISIAIAVYSSHKKFSWLDIFYLFIVLSLVSIRYFDIKYWGGQTSTGERATISDWRRYSLFMIFLTLLVLAAVHGLGLVGK